MKYFILFSLLIFGNFNCQNINVAQKNIYLAQYYEKIENQKVATDFYEKAFNQWSEMANAYFFDALRLGIKTKNYLFIKTLFNEAYKHYEYKETEVFENKWIVPLLTPSKKAKLLSLINRYKRKYTSRLVKNNAELDEIIKSDQEIRNDNSYLNNPEEIKKIDSVNFDKLVLLAKKNGWDNRYKIVLLHQRGSIEDNTNQNWNFFKQLINNEIAKGSVKKDFFVYFYFLNSLAHRSALKYDFYPPLEDSYSQEDIDEIDENRKSVGLPPLYFTKFLEPEFPLPKGYKYNPENLLSDLEKL